MGLVADALGDGRKVTVALEDSATSEILMEHRFEPERFADAAAAASEMLTGAQDLYAREACEM